MSNAAQVAGTEVCHHMFSIKSVVATCGYITHVLALFGPYALLLMMDVAWLPLFCKRKFLKAFYSTKASLQMPLPTVAGGDRT